MDKEVTYQAVVRTIFALLGFECEAEKRTSHGRIDLVIKTDDFIYCFEFKKNASAESALEQIDSKEYAVPFEKDKRKLIKVGV